MIVKNEERVLARCLDSVADLVDEINIVDTGSTDRTKEIAALYTDRIYDFQWVDDFAAARNYSFEQATCSHIMWLDADDIIREKDRKELKRMKEELPEHIDSIVMEYHLAFDQAGNATAGARRNRIVRREKGYRWRSPIHEYLDVKEGAYYIADAAVSHHRVEDHSARNMRIIEQKLLQGTEMLEGRDLFNYANELADQHSYAEAAQQYERFVADAGNLEEDRTYAYLRLAECYQHLGRAEQKLQSLLLGLQFDKPRADICCSIGYCFEERGNYMTAIHWYEIALTLPKPAFYMGLLNLVCWTWMPHVQLCICYAKLGELQKANEHNEKALAYLPDDVNLLDNKAKLEQALVMSAARSADGAVSEAAAIEDADAEQLAKEHRAEGAEAPGAE